uniref:Protein phosphatase inhibitor n=1 Tax=Caenorhabditis tropicalis TaxID=1561998 RepID=A0A1I7TDM1_9PELO
MCDVCSQKERNEIDKDVGEEDNVNSPSSRIVMGALPRGGTGSFDLLLDTNMQSEREEMEAERAAKRGSKLNKF